MFGACLCRNFAGIWYNKGSMRYLSGLFLFFLALSGCTNTQIFLANLPSNLGSYTSHNNIKYGSEEWQYLNLFQPDVEDGEKVPIVVFIYGGKWKSGEKERYKFAGEAFTARGYVAVVPDYVKYPQGKFPQFVKDVALAVKWVHENAAEYSGDRNNIFLVGHSAGAHIAGLLAADGRYLEEVGGNTGWIKGVVGMAGPYAFNPADYKLTKTFGGDDNLPDSQVINFITGKEPPFLLLHGLKDNVVNPSQSDTLADRIKERGGVAEVIYYDNVDHRGPIRALTRYYRRDFSVLPDIVTFIQKYRSP